MALLEMPLKSQYLCVVLARIQYSKLKFNKLKHTESKTDTIRVKGFSKELANDAGSF